MRNVLKNLNDIIMNYNWEQEELDDWSLAFFSYRKCWEKSDVSLFLLICEAKMLSKHID